MAAAVWLATGAAALGCGARNKELAVGGGGGSGGATGGVGSGGASCQHLDIVVALDDSSSMEEEQKALRTTVLPAFVRGLRADLPMLQDFRAAVIDACPTPANFHVRGDGGPCAFAGGQPWMESRSPSLEDELRCVGDVYSGDAACPGNNDNEQPASAAATALESPAQAPGGPNDGFLRSGAVLVVVAATDEDEQPVPGRTAREVYERLIAVKGNAVERMVFVGIGATKSCEGPYGSAEPASKLKDIADLFADHGRGVFWDLCAGKLEDDLDDVLGVIKGACADVVPPSCPTGATVCGARSDCPTGTYCVSRCCLPRTR